MTDPHDPWRFTRPEELQGEGDEPRPLPGARAAIAGFCGLGAACFALLAWWLAS